MSEFTPDDKKVILESLLRIEQTLSTIAKASLRSVVEQELSHLAARKVYDLTGSRPIKEISQTTGMATGSISRLWSRWEQLGILIKDGKRYRKAV